MPPPVQEVVEESALASALSRAQRARPHAVAGLLSLAQVRAHQRWFDALETLEPEEEGGRTSKEEL